MNFLPSTHPSTSSHYYTIVAPNLNSVSQFQSMINKKRFRNASQRFLQMKLLASQYRFEKKTLQHIILVLPLQGQHRRREQSQSKLPINNQLVVHNQHTFINPHRSDP